MTEASKKLSTQTMMLDIAKQYWPAFIALPLWVLVFLPLFRYCWAEWQHSSGYYSHGFIVPCMSAYVIWANRRRLASMLIKPSWWGIALIVPSIPLYVFGVWTNAMTMVAAAFFAVTAGAVLLFAGSRVARVLFFPLLFLSFMIPLPGPVLDEVTTNAQLQSTRVAAAMLDASGYDVQRSGSKIESSELPEPLLVGVECSGMKLLISLLTFTAFLVYIVDARGQRLREIASRPRSQLPLRLLGDAFGFVVCAAFGYLLRGLVSRIVSGVLPDSLELVVTNPGVIAVVAGIVGVLIVELIEWRKWVLILAAIPLSLFINSLRIAMIGYAGIWTGSSDAMHQFHDYSGYIGLVICFVILFGFARMIGAGTFWFSNQSQSQPASPVVRKRHSPSVAGITALVLILAMLAVNARLQPLRTTVKGSIERSTVPISFGSWSSESIPIEKRVLNELGSGDSLQRLYTSSYDGAWVSLFMTAGKDNNAFHNPLACIQMGGSPISKTRRILLDIKRPRPVKVQASLLQAEDPRGSSTILIYWYMRERETFSTTSAMRADMRTETVRDLWDSVVRFYTDRRHVAERVSKRQYVWYRFSAEVTNDPETDLRALKEFVIDFIAHHPSFGESAQ